MDSPRDAEEVARAVEQEARALFSAYVNGRYSRTDFGRAMERQLVARDVDIFAEHLGREVAAILAREPRP